MSGLPAGHQQSIIAFGETRVVLTCECGWEGGFCASGSIADDDCRADDILTGHLSVVQLPRGTRHASYSALAASIADLLPPILAGKRALTRPEAAAIAAAFQAPTGSGAVLAAFASGRAVVGDDLADAVQIEVQAAGRRRGVDGPEAEADYRVLTALHYWVIDAVADARVAAIEANRADRANS